MRKYSVSDLKRFLNDGQIDPMLWMVHFPNALDTRIPTCRDCTDYAICSESKDFIEVNPIDCFLGQKGDTEIITDASDDVDDEDEGEAYKRSQWK